jgi:hypothetical protein
MKNIIANDSLVFIKGINIANARSTKLSANKTIYE